MYRIFFSVLLLCAYTEISIAMPECASTFKEKEEKKQERAQWIAQVGNARAVYHSEALEVQPLTVDTTGNTSKARLSRVHASNPEKVDDAHPAYRLFYKTNNIAGTPRQNTFGVEASYRHPKEGKKAKTPGKWALFLDYLDMQKAIADHNNILAFNFIEHGTFAEILHEDVTNVPILNLLKTYYERNGGQGSTITVSRDSTGAEKLLFDKFFELLPDKNNSNALTSHIGTQTQGFVGLVSKHEGQEYVIDSIHIDPNTGDIWKDYDITFSVVDET